VTQRLKEISIYPQEGNFVFVIVSLFLRSK